MSTNASNADYSITDLLEIMDKLRDPENGCPWDIEQSFESIAPYTIEESYEVDEAIRANDMASLRDELGDLLFQVIFHSQMAKEEHHFTFSDVVQTVCKKMIRRHPHVFGNATIQDADAQVAAWEDHKAKEREAKAKTEGRVPSVLDGVTVGLPSLLRAIKLQNRAARIGFDWPETIQVLDKIQEESLELLEEYQSGGSKARLKEEFGDLLFVMANLARHMDIDPEEALRAGNAKFEKRFRKVEEQLAILGKAPRDSNLEEMNQFWNQAKEEEKR